MIDEEDDGFDDDRDRPQEIDLDTDDDEERVKCSRCGAFYHEDSPRCPKCGYWPTGESLAAERSRKWLWPVMIAALIGMMLVMWHGLGR